MSRVKKEEMKLEGLQIQYDLLDALQARHRIWAEDSQDPDIESVHLEIIELIRQTREKYALLLSRYSKQSGTQAS
jgi:hypothetical protein